MSSSMNTFDTMGDAILTDMEPGDPEASVIKEEASFFVAKIPRGLGKQPEFTSQQGQVVLPDLDGFSDAGTTAFEFQVRLCTIIVMLYNHYSRQLL